MDSAPENPMTNALGPGVAEDQVLAAVTKSGYPLQTQVALVIRSTAGPLGEPFQVHDEWSYVDRDSGELRMMDVHATLRLHGWDPPPRVRPQLNLLIECKQSELPYVFFLASSNVFLIDFPGISGLRSDKLVLTSDDDPSSWTLSIIHALDLHEEPFSRTARFCHTLSKCVRKGSDLALSGSEAYSSLVLPMIKAIDHFHHAERPVETARYFDAHLTLGVGVLDAPMIAVTVEEEKAVLTAVPWVRVVRHEYDERQERFERERQFALDIVHKDYLSPYLNDHLLPFAEEFAKRVLRHPTELAAGRGFVSGMGSNSWNAIERRMKPKSATSRAAWGMAVGRRIMGLFSRRDRLD